MIAKGAAALSRRRGQSMIEVAVTALMLVIAMSMTLHVLTWVAAERRALDRRQFALQETANLMERLTARPWDELTSETAKRETLAEPARQALPGAELSVGVDEAKDHASKRVTIALRWRTRAGTWDAPVRLTAWTYRGRLGR
jgi:Tfp pilus assembly protein PilV